MNGRSMARVGMGAGVLMAMSGCHTEIVTSVTVTKVTVEPGQAVVPQGDGLQFTATVFDDLDQALDQAAVEWSSGAPGVVSVEADGAAHALSPGFTLVKASFNGVSGTAWVTVVSVPACSPKRDGRHRDRDRKNDDDDDNDDVDDDGDDDVPCAPPSS
jgi:hypothetical protein